MKKFICILMILVLAFSLFACSKSDDSKKDNDKSISNVGGAEKPQSVTVNKNDVLPTIDETVLVDKDGLKIIAKELIKEKLYGNDEFAVKLEITNNTGSDLSVSSCNTYVNDFAIDTDMYTNISNGNTASPLLFLRKKEIEKSHIDTIAKIETRFKVSTFSSKTDMTTIITSSGENFDYSFDASGEVIYDNKNIKVVVKDTYKYNDTTYTEFYIENNSDEIVNVELNKVLVNGEDESIYLNALPVYQGKRCLALLEYNNEELTPDNINELSFQLKLVNNNLFKIDTVDNIKITL